MYLNANFQFYFQIFVGVFFIYIHFYYNSFYLAYTKLCIINLINYLNLFSLFNIWRVSVLYVYGNERDYMRFVYKYEKLKIIRYFLEKRHWNRIRLFSPHDLIRFIMKERYLNEGTGVSQAVRCHVFGAKISLNCQISI